MNRWSPDTCGCVFDFEPHPDGQSQILVAVINKCSAHAGLDGEVLHNTVHKKENVMKNKVHGKFMEDIDLVDITQDDEGNEVRNFKKGIKFEWHFLGSNGNRTLVVKNDKLKLSDKKKTDYVALFDLEHGAGKVQIA